MTQTVSLGDVIGNGEIICHNNLRSPLNSRQRSEMLGGYLYYGATGPMDSINQYKFNGYYVLVAEDGTVHGLNGVSPMIQRISGKFWVSNHAHVLCGQDDIDTRYLALALEASDVRPYVTGAVQLKLSKENLFKLKIYWPNRIEREKILNQMDPLDEKIELNRKMNKTLEQIGQALFRHYFIDNPKAEGWERRELGEFFPIKTGKKDANYSSADGDYPFFTCSQSILKAPDYSFDGHALLLAGNGEFNLKLYRGKFEAYQRTYVLIPEREELLGVLYFLMKLKLPEITGGSRGSVIKFITKGMIENYKFPLPNDIELVKMAKIFNQITINIEENVQEIQTLTSLRDSLLPRLMNRKVKLDG